MGAHRRGWTPAASVYQNVIIEYKNPASSARIGETLDSAGSRKLVEQIKSRFRDLQTELARPINSLFGVGCDGMRFIFVRWRDAVTGFEISHPRARGVAFTRMVAPR